MGHPKQRTPIFGNPRVLTVSKGDLAVPGVPKCVSSRMQRGLPTFVLAGSFFDQAADMGNGVKGFVSNHGLEVLIRAAPASKVLQLSAKIEANELRVQLVVCNSCRTLYNHKN